MKKLYIITGAAGHLGSTIIKLLESRNQKARGLILPSESAENTKNTTYYKGDVTQPDSMRPLFEDTGNSRLILIHTAGIIDISGELTPKMYDVNVNGTKNVLKLCTEYNVSRMVYVSSVHALPEKSRGLVITETDTFSPDTVTGGYAKTKALATQAVLFAAENGLDGVVVHPSGILGPYDDAHNHMVQMIRDYVSGKLPACVKGGYDFVDVRDVAEGCLAAAEKGRRGDCYILSNRHYDVKEVLSMAKSVGGGRRLPVLPVWMAKAVSPFIRLDAKIKKRRPLYTLYSLDTLCSNDRFSHDKATAELGYRPRDLYETVKDTVLWFRKQGILKLRKKAKNK